MRDRLIELIEKAVVESEFMYPADVDPVCIADYLLANGVIALPCQKGAILNRNGEKCIADHWNIILTTFNEDDHVCLFDVKEVEAKLKERGGND